MVGRDCVHHSAPQGGVSGIKSVLLQGKVPIEYQFELFQIDV